MKKLLLILSLSVLIPHFVRSQAAPPHSGQANGIVNPSSGGPGGGTTPVNSDKVEDLGTDDVAPPPPPPPPPPPAPAPVRRDTAYHGDSSAVFDYVEQMPSFPGDSMNQYLAHQIHLPAGDITTTPPPKTCYIGFVVEKDGKVSNAYVKKSSGHPSIDDEILKAVQGMPNWNPGKMSGQAVRERMVIPVKVELK